VLRDRLFTAAVGIPLLVALVGWAPSWLFAAVILAVAVLGLWEYFSLVRPLLSLPPAIGIGWGVAVAATMTTFSLSLSVIALLIGLFAVFTATLRNHQPERGLVDVSLSLLGVVYVGFLLPHIMWLREVPNGWNWVFFLFLVVMLGDSAAYGIGRMWGSHKLIPHISPGKTVEGSLGAYLGNVGAAAGAWFWLLPDRALGELLLLALGLGSVAQVGDLCESALKRACGAKDSGRILPGHGGVLDRVDSLLFPSAVLYYYMMLST
jgi:phosphatidate cytidylyltransferase